MEDEPLAHSMKPAGEPTVAGNQGRFRDVAGKVSTTAGEAWEQTKEKAGIARERTEFFLRENPVPTVIGALALGVAIGLAIRYASSTSEREVEVKSPLENVDLSFLSLPFLWPLFKSVRRKYDDSTEAVKDGVDRMKNVDVDRYVKPLRKKWKSWTN